MLLFALAFTFLAPVILIDNRNSSDPYINLAIEEYVVRHFDFSQYDYVLMYINQPSVVLGKNQSIYRELNFDILRQPILKLCRRISGGGTVYHDEGNISFAFFSAFSDNKVNNYSWFNRPIIDALQQLGIDAQPDKRNSIFFQGKKISGNAQFTNRKAILSHGTLLFSADMELLRKALKPNEFEVQSKAPESVRSEVQNLSAFLPQFKSTADFKKYLQDAMNLAGVYSFNADQWSEIEHLAAEKFKSDSWIYGRSPLTEIVKDKCRITVENGVVTKLDCGDTFVENLLTGSAYTYASFLETITNKQLEKGEYWINRLF